MSEKKQTTFLKNLFAREVVFVIIKANNDGKPTYPGCVEVVRAHWCY
jgi:hypothetical protein